MAGAPACFYQRWKSSWNHTEGMNLQANTVSNIRNVLITIKLVWASTSVRCSCSELISYCDLCLFCWKIFVCFLGKCQPCSLFGRMSKASPWAQSAHRLIWATRRASVRPQSPGALWNHLRSPSRGLWAAWDPLPHLNRPLHWATKR